MNKVFSKGSLILFGSLVLLTLIAWGVKTCFYDVPIRATVYPQNVELGTPIYFSDSTKNAQTVTWEFGNGDLTNQRSGEYTFNEEGQYQVRLTINNTKCTYFLVNVKAPKNDANTNAIKIIAPDVAFQNERVVFMADGKSDNWNWEFGETGMLDSKERNPIYFYSKTGTFQVKLFTSNMKYPVFHTIRILPGGTTPPPPPPPSDIKLYLQKIIERKGSFNENYAKIKSLLKANDNMPVLVNGTKENTLYDYCTGLKIMGKQQSTLIFEATEELDSNGKIKRLLVTQSTIE